jgi:hypothetical protein
VWRLDGTGLHKYLVQPTTNKTKKKQWKKRDIGCAFLYMVIAHYISE